MSMLKTPQTLAALLFTATVCAGVSAWSYLEGVANARTQDRAAFVAEIRAFTEAVCR